MGTSPAPCEGDRDERSFMTRIKQAFASTEYRIFLAGLTIALAHLCDDALIEHENGSSAAAQAGAVAAALAITVVPALVYPWLARVARPVVLLGYGLLALSGGWGAHVSHALDHGASGGDYSGSVYAAAGAMLVGAGLVGVARTIRGLRTA
jgi:hypothetical protein